MRISRFLLVLPVLLVLVLLNSCGDYGFGLREEDYPQYFGPNSGGLNRVRKFNANYSLLTTLPIGSGTIEVEHGVVASNEDIERVGLKPGRYLFSSIQIHDPSVRMIRTAYKCGESPLEPAGTYIFRSSRLPDGGLDPAKPNWEVSAYGGAVLSEAHGFGYIRLYALTSDCVSLFSKKPLHEQITIEALQDGSVRSYNFSFTSHWHKAGAWWWRVLNVT